MKYLLGVVMLSTLASCALFGSGGALEGVGAALQDPGVQVGLKETGGALGSGDYIGALYGIGSTITAYLAWRSGKHVVKRMQESSPGQII